MPGTTSFATVAGPLYSLKELRDTEKIDVLHYLIVDAYDTWWDDGKSYLCRMIDMLNMGYVDEVLFGREVLERLPILVPEWIARAAKVVADHPSVQTEWDASHKWQQRVETEKKEKEAAALAREAARIARQSKQTPEGNRQLLLGGPDSS